MVPNKFSCAVLIAILSLNIQSEAALPSAHASSLLVCAAMPETILQDAYIKSGNSDPFDHFGSALAISGDTLVVGAPYEDSDGTGVDSPQNGIGAQNSGAAYVFVKVGGVWSQEAYLKASNTDSDDRFGSAVAISGDTIVVGAIRESSASSGPQSDQSDNSAQNAGAAYVFRRTGTTWVQEAYLKASNPEQGDQFGYSVAVHGDRILVGAKFESSSATGINGDQSNNDNFYSGAAYLFERNQTGWVQEAYVKPSNTSGLINFGHAVALGSDCMVITALNEASGSTGINGNQFDTSAIQAGAAYVFRLQSGAWTQEAYVKASNTQNLDNFGVSVALSGDRFVVGASGEDSDATGVDGDQNNDNSLYAGAAYVFDYSGGNWTQKAYLKASNSASFDFFGIRVAVADDTIVIGALGEDSPATGINGEQGDAAPTFPSFDAGAAYVFLLSGPQCSQPIWRQVAYVKASNTGIDDSFGSALAISEEKLLVVGAEYEDGDATGIYGFEGNDNAEDSGAVYAFELSFDLDSEQVVRLGTPPNPAALLPGIQGPAPCKIWDPVIDHTSFMPDAVLDVLLFSVFPENVLVPPFGTVLCSSPFLYRFKPAGVPFQLPISSSPTLIGVQLCVSGGSADLLGNFLLTNAIDITIGAQ